MSMNNNYSRKRSSFTRNRNYPPAKRPYTPNQRYTNQPRYPNKSQLNSAKVQSARYLATLSSRGNAGEVKWFDSRIRDIAVSHTVDDSAIFSAKSVDNVSTYYALNCPAQGNSDNERIGKQIKMKSLFIRGDITINTSILDDAYCRIVVYMDMQNNNTTPGASSVIPFEELTSFGSYNAMRNLDYTSRFKILHDEMLHFKPQFTSWYNGAAAVHQTHACSLPFTKFVDLKAMKVNYNATGATSASIVDNAIYVCAFMDTPGATLSTSVATCNFVARLRYTE